MSLKKFSIKDPDEIIQYSFDYSLVMPLVSEDIVSVFWEIIDQQDSTETNITSMIVPSMESRTTRICSNYIKEGTPGVNYVLSCEVTTNIGEKIKIAGIIPVKTFK